VSSSAVVWLLFGRLCEPLALDRSILKTSLLKSYSAIMEDPEFIDQYTNKGGTAAILEGFAYIKDVRGVFSIWPKPS
jgi:hypothetical protein